MLYGIRKNRNICVSEVTPGFNFLFEIGFNIQFLKVQNKFFRKILTLFSA